MTFQWHYRLEGPDHAPGLLLLHGFMGDQREWSLLWDQLTPHFRCLAVDLPGHGQTQATHFAMEPVAEGLVSLIARLGLREMRLWGYSMGGRLGLYLLLRYPALWQAGILESSSPGLPTESEREHRRKIDHKRAQWLETDDFSVFLSAWYQQPLFERLRKHPRFPEILAQRQHNDPLLLARSLREMGTGAQPSLWETLAHLQVPAQALVGQEDPKFIKLAQAMADQQPLITVTTVPGCGHNVHLENPQASLKCALPFLLLAGATALQ